MIDFKSKDPKSILTDLTSPDRYSDLLQMGLIKKEYETQKGFPVDGSLKQLRSYAPFVIEVIPPLIFTNNSNVNSQKKESPNLFTSAWKTNSSFSKAKANLETKVFQRQSLGKATETKQKLQSVINNSGNKDTIESYLTDAKQAADIASQLLGILKAPPVVLLVNPQSMAIQRTKIQQFSERTRNGFVFQAWGESHPQITFDCRIGAFYAGAYEPVGNGASTTTPSGVQWASRHNSASWQNLVNVFQVYLNNGYIVDSVGKTFVHHMVGCLAIRYDQWLYLGNMKTFSFSYDATGQQGGIQFNFTFGCIAIYDLAPFNKNVLPLRNPNTGV